MSTTRTRTNAFDHNNLSIFIQSEKKRSNQYEIGRKKRGKYRKKTSGAASDNESMEKNKNVLLVSLIIFFRTGLFSY